jgi:ATP-binding protein involved in chromosome partitioning
MTLTESKITYALSHLILPCGRRLTETKMISSIIINDNKVGFAINIDKKDSRYALELKEKAQKIIIDTLKCDKVSVVITSGSHITETELTQSKNLIKLKPLGIKKIICITSCKGGVGKSTITALLAKKLTAKNINVGILDADIYGPSIPNIFDVKSQHEIVESNIEPHICDNISIVSIGAIVDKDKAGIWRGPMVTKTLHQLLFKSKWANIDILLIDMPPGTGDVALSLTENYFLDGAIIATTPSKLAVIDNVKTVDMLRKLNIGILAVVENMSYLQIGDKKLTPFGEGGGEVIRKLVDNNILLTKIPLSDNVLDNEGTYLNDLVKFIITNLTIA